MEAYIIIGAVIIVITKTIYDIRKYNKEEEIAKRQNFCETLKRKVALNKEVDDIIKKYQSTLCRKFKQTHYADDYGKTIENGWYREIQYFIENVMVDELSSIDGLDMGRIVHNIDTYINEVINNEDTNNETIYKKEDIKTGIDYENFVENILNNADFNVSRTPTTGDQGVDLIVTKNNIKIAVQCKFYSKPVGNKAVQEVIAGKDFYECEYACVVSNNTFTTAAKKLASVSNVKLVNEDNIAEELCEILGITNIKKTKSNKNIKTLYNNMNKDKIKSYIKEGGNINLQDDSGLTLLMKSCYEEDSEIADILLQAGADTEIRDYDGLTALLHACYVSNIEVVKILIESGADVNAKNKEGVTALSTACLKKDKDVVRMLLQAGADIEAEDNRGLKALMVACFKGNTEIVEMLIKANADVNARNSNNSLTALMYACNQGNTDIVKMLVKANANVNVKDDNGTSILKYACEGTNTEIIDILFNAGANY